MEENNPIVLQHKDGAQLEVLAYGASIYRLLVPDRKGRLVDVVVGPKDAKTLSDPAFGFSIWCMGSSVGPFAGRISGGGFELMSNKFPLKSVNGICLHSGADGWQNRRWKLEEISDADIPFVRMSLSADEQEFEFPGKYTAEVTYRLENSALKIDYRVKTELPMIINPTNHTYFNPGGSISLKGCQLKINASAYLETDQKLIPTGKKLEVTDTPFDFMQERIFQGHTVLDTCFVLEDKGSAAEVYSPETGIFIQAETNQPGLVAFTPKKLSGLQLKDQMETVDFPAICLECQNFPDAPNQKAFPSSVLLPGQCYHNEIIYGFGTR